MENFGLGKNGCSCFGIGKVCAITDAPNIAVLFVSESSLVAIEIASCISKARFSNVGVRTHRWNHMEQIKFLYNFLLGLSIFKGSLIVFNFDQGVFEDGVDVVTRSNMSQGLRIFGNTKHNTDGFIKFNRNWKFVL